jgi:hypothetical protein
MMARTAEGSEDPQEWKEDPEEEQAGFEPAIFG